MDRDQSCNQRKESDLEVGVSARDFFQRFRRSIQKLGMLKYAILAILIGILFLLPTKKEKTTASVMAPADIMSLTSEADIETKMSQILSSVHGAGEVQVMLTVRNNGRTEYQTDVENYSNGEQTEMRQETVFGNSANASGALICMQTMPEYLGALVISQGADSAEVCLNLKKAVCGLTGLSSDKVTVLKMNEWR